jgi:RHS repeat-associated protein
VTNSAGAIISTIELDPWRADTSRSSNAAFQPKKFTSYERDANGTDEAMFRRYNRWQSRFDQADPYAGSYDASDPQSFNRYAYTQGDPVNYVDPTGLRWILPQTCSTVLGVEGGGITCSFGEAYWLDNPAPGSRDSLERNPKGGVSGQTPTAALAKGDQWYGHNDRNFQRWFHRCYKEAGDPDASKEELAEAYAEWISRGSPKGGNCYGGGGDGEKSPVPGVDPSRVRKDLRRIINAPHWPLVPSPDEIHAIKTLSTAGGVVLAIYLIYVLTTTAPAAAVP